jgi:hypothetical protein
MIYLTSLSVVQIWTFSGRISNEQWIGRDMKGSLRELLLLHLPEGSECSHEENLSEWSFSWPRSEPGISRLESSRATQYTLIILYILINPYVCCWTLYVHRGYRNRIIGGKWLRSVAFNLPFEVRCDDRRKYTAGRVPGARGHSLHRS